MCNGGMIWSCCVPRDRVAAQASQQGGSQHVGAVHNASEFGPAWVYRPEHVTSIVQLIKIWLQVAKTVPSFQFIKIRFGFAH